MSSLYPFRFEPIFRRYLWGGRRLATELNRAIGEGNCAESWEIVDHGQDQSLVREGPLAGVSLHELVERHGPELFGRHAPQSSFPLLFKFLDANQVLSVQVHPTDELAARLDPPDLGKTEAWVILARHGDAKLYAGLCPDPNGEPPTRETIERAIRQGNLEEYLHVLEPEIGDCVFLPAGAVHAIGAGLLVAEIQQASDTTYRLFDWNRVGQDGQPRALHVEAGLEAIDFDRGPVQPQTPRPTDRPSVVRLVDCDKFILDRWRFDSPQLAGGDDRFHLFAVLDGGLEVACQSDWAPDPLGKGDVLLAPACSGDVSLRPSGGVTLLDMYLP